MIIILHFDEKGFFTMYNILFFTHSQKRHGLKKIKSNQKETAALPLTDVFWCFGSPRSKPMAFKAEELETIDAAMVGGALHL